MTCRGVRLNMPAKPHSKKKVVKGPAAVQKAESVGSVNTPVPATSSAPLPVTPVNPPVPPVVDASKPFDAPVPVSEHVSMATEPVEAAPSEDSNLEDILDDDPEESRLDKKNSALFFFGILFTIAMIISSAGLFVIYLRTPKVVNMPSPAIKHAVVSAKPTPLAMPADITVEVLNGSGITGAAGKAASELAGRGYQVIAVKNSKKIGTTQVFVSLRLSQPQSSLLLADMSTLFGVSSSSGDLTDSTASARIILGAK